MRALLAPPFRRLLVLFLVILSSSSLSVVSSSSVEGSALLLILFLRCKTLSILSKLLTLLSLSASEALREELVDVLFDSSSEIEINIFLLKLTRYYQGSINGKRNFRHHFGGSFQSVSADACLASPVVQTSTVCARLLQGRQGRIRNATRIYLHLPL